MPVAALVTTGALTGNAVMSGANADVNMTGPAIAQLVGTSLAPLTISLATQAAPLTVVSSLPTSASIQFTDQYNDCGSGSFLVPLVDSSGAANPDATAIVLDNLVTVTIYGNDAWTMLVESMERVMLTRGEEHDQVLNVTGRGHLAIWEEAVVYPSRGVNVEPVEEDRTFNWTSPVFDDSAWGNAKEIVQQGASTGYYQNFPPSWQDPTAFWIWAHSGTETDAPVGICYFRKFFTIPPGITQVVLFASIDNGGEVYFDGQHVPLHPRGPGFISDGLPIDVTPGDHLIAVAGSNYPLPPDAPSPPAPDNPAGVLVTCYEWIAGATQGSILVNTDGSWKIVEYPPFPPGMTPGQVIRVALAEANARGALGGMTLGFSDTLDSAGQPWPEVTDIATKVGTNYLTFLKELSVTYVDIWMQPRQKRLLAWNRNTRGRTSAVNLHAPTNPNDPTTGNATELAARIIN